MSKIISISHQEFPFICKSTLGAEFPDFAHSTDSPTIMPLEFALFDSLIVRGLILRDYILEISSEDMKEVEELKLMRWPRETKPLFQIK